VRRGAGLALVCGLTLLLGVAVGGARVARAGEESETAAAHAPGQAGEAEHEHEPEIHGKNLAMQLLNFAVLAFILVKFGGGAINKALLARHEQLKVDLTAAAEARRAAEERAEVQGKRLGSLEDEIAALRAGIKQEAEAEKARLIATAEERAARIAEETRFLLDQQVKEAEALLRREVAEAAVKIAEQLVTRALDGRDQQRMLDSFVDDVAGKPGSPA
jgi:F-type H+-transporting ATPase subunit b